MLDANQEIKEYREYHHQFREFDKNKNIGPPSFYFQFRNDKERVNVTPHPIHSKQQNRITILIKSPSLPDRIPPGINSVKRRANMISNILPLTLRQGLSRLCKIWTLTKYQLLGIWMLDLWSRVSRDLTVWDPAVIIVLKMRLIRIPRSEMPRKLSYHFWISSIIQKVSIQSRIKLK